jgi:alpha-N-arabinofuranosidase
VLDLLVESAGYDVPELGTVPYLDVAGTFDAKTGESCFLILNRDLAKEHELTMVWREAAPARVLACRVLTGPDLKASNSFDEPQRVVPQPLEPPRPGERMTVKLPRQSYTLLHLAAEAGGG